MKCDELIQERIVQKNYDPVRKVILPFEQNLGVFVSKLYLCFLHQTSYSLVIEY